MKHRACHRCFYFEPVEGPDPTLRRTDKWAGECRFHPPVPDQGFPLTHKEAWCGQFQCKKEWTQ